MISALMLSSLLMVSGLQDPQLTSPTFYAKESGIIALQAIPALFLTVLIHESGHALSAAAMGMKVSKFEPYPTKCGDSLALGCTHIDYSRSNIHERMWMIGSGMLATRFVAEGSDLLMNTINMHPRIKQTGAILYFMNRLDAVSYVFRCAIAPCDSSADPQGLVEQITHNRLAQMWLYVGMVSIMVLDIMLDWDEIKVNWNRLWLQ